MSWSVYIRYSYSIIVYFFLSNDNKRILIKLVKIFRFNELKKYIYTKNTQKRTHGPYDKEHVYNSFLINMKWTTRTGSHTYMYIYLHVCLGI
jgi:hypothetical protein